MTSDKIDKLNGIGVIFRFITPFFQFILTITSALIIAYLMGLKTDMAELKMHFTNHLSEHKQIEIVLEKRLTYLETLLKKIK